MELEDFPENLCQNYVLKYSIETKNLVRKGSISNLEKKLSDELEMCLYCNPTTGRIKDYEVPCLSYKPRVRKWKEKKYLI